MPNSLNTIDLAGVPRFAGISDYFGLWAVEESRFWQVFQRAKHMDLAAHVQTNADRMQQLSERRAEGGGSRYLVAEGDQRGRDIAVIQISGTMMKRPSSLDEATSTVELRRQIRHAAASSDIGGILLLIESPGGTVSGTADLAADVRAAAQAKPTWAFIEDLGASAAYWVASQADRIDANHRTALVGSIGTIIALYDLSKLAEKEGIEALVFATGELKGAGVPGSEVTAEQRAYFQRIVDETQKSFSAAVLEGRGMTADQLAPLATGEVFHADRALEVGLIDAIRPFEQTLAALRDEVARRNQTENIMSKTQQAATPPEHPKANQPDPDQAQSPQPTEDPKAQPQQPDTAAKGDQAKADQLEAQREANPQHDGQAFLDAFGEQGAVWFAQGKSFAEAQQLHVEKLQQENKDLKQRLATVDRGAVDPIDLTPEGGQSSAGQNRLAQSIGSNLARYAAGLELPGRN